MSYKKLFSLILAFAHILQALPKGSRTIYEEESVERKNNQWAAFTPGTFGVDNNYEAFGVYFPGGDYIGPEFNFYYKRPLPADFVEMLGEIIANDIYRFMVAQSQLSDSLLPYGVFDYRYATQICTKNNKGKVCDKDTYSQFVHWHFSWNK